jgi:hypothetical protein
MVKREMRKISTFINRGGGWWGNKCAFNCKGGWLKIFQTSILPTPVPHK